MGGGRGATSNPRRRPDPPSFYSSLNDLVLERRAEQLAMQNSQDFSTRADGQHNGSLADRSDLVWNAVQSNSPYRGSRPGFLNQPALTANTAVPLARAADDAARAFRQEDDVDAQHVEAGCSPRIPDRVLLFDVQPSARRLTISQLVSACVLQHCNWAT
ncbi:hypothetical protein T492DRAFT_1055301 [Pavlovales sp. CCMP2436]|nr:hypothetical protein T492DRAFT_1055301 [Pavlovales sp. CCMP2436]